MSKVLKTLKKNKDIEWKYVNGVLTPFRNGKEVKLWTRHKELGKAVSGDLSNAFRDILKVPSKALSRFAKNPNIKDYVKEKYSPTDKSPEANAWRNLAEKNKETQAKNEAKLEELRILRSTGADTATRNWSNPYMGPEYEEDEKLRKKAEAATKEYQKKKFDSEIAADRAEDSLQDKKELGISTKPGMYEWTTDQKVDESAKKLTGEFWQEPEFKSEGKSKGENRAKLKSTGTGSFDKKLTKIYGKRKMKRFNQVYGKLNLSDRMKRHLLMSKAFRDM